MQWATLIIAYLDGKPLGREERGQPGEFERIDLSQYTSEELRAFIRAVKPPKEEPEREPMQDLARSEPPLSLEVVRERDRSESGASE